jgi:putative cell wall-binding protein
MISTHIRDRAATSLFAVLAALAVVFALFPLTASAQENGGDEVEGDPFNVESERLEGVNRFATAAEIAVETFGTAPEVVVASGEVFPDALSGNYLAGIIEGPVLLSTRDPVGGGLQVDLEGAIDDLEVETIYVAGGDFAVSDEVVELLEEKVGEDNVIRIFGPTRYETAAEIAIQSNTTDGDVEDAEGDNVGTARGDRTAFVVTGERFPDALASGPISYAEQLPILLTLTASLHPAAREALEDLDIERVIIAGGTGAVAESVAAEIRAMGIEVERFFGTGRIETAIELAEFAQEEFDFTLVHTNIAAAQREFAPDDPQREIRFADALAMGPHAGEENSPLLLTAGNQPEVPATLDAYLRDNACEIIELHLAGGEGVITAEHEDNLVEAASDCEGTIVLDPESGPAGTQVTATFAFGGDLDFDDVDNVTVAGDCIADEEFSDELGDDGTFVFDIDGDAEVGACELTITVTFDDDTVVIFEVTFDVTEALPGIGD